MNEPNTSLQRRKKKFASRFSGERGSTHADLGLILTLSLSLLPLPPIYRRKGRRERGRRTREGKGWKERVTEGERMREGLYTKGEGRERERGGGRESKGERVKIRPRFACADPLVGKIKSNF